MNKKWGHGQPHKNEFLRYQIFYNISVLTIPCQNTAGSDVVIIFHTISPDIVSYLIVLGDVIGKLHRVELLLLVTNRKTPDREI
ncbi:hypothetical protein AOY61_19515 [Escherichia coli]|nr:hypothetical protein AOY61_19515 [Escherichia coli]